MKTLLGRARAKKGMFEGDLDEGELEIGQVSALIREIKPAGRGGEGVGEDYETALKELIKS
jgi:enoyl-[acyl-carrier protein] reductase II